ncbi:MAG: redoxin domain-containing protein, partial [Thermoplasmata archaeon]
MMQLPLNIGDPAPDFELPGVDEKTYRLESFADKDILGLMFMCVHCPTVKIYEDRLIATQNDYAARGVQMVGINPNDSVKYPEDSFESMTRRAKEMGYPFPYLRDKTQAVAEAYGAQ